MPRPSFSLDLRVVCSSTCPGFAATAKVWCWCCSTALVATCLPCCSAKDICQKRSPSSTLRRPTCLSFCRLGKSHEVWFSGGVTCRYLSWWMHVWTYKNLGCYGMIGKKHLCLFFGVPGAKKKRVAPDIPLGGAAGSGTSPRKKRGLPRPEARDPGRF